MASTNRVSLGGAIPGKGGLPLKTSEVKNPALFSRDERTLRRQVPKWRAYRWIILWLEIAAD
jgi:hypothetical protein